VRISLINPPFATVRLPSLGLTQLKARLRALYGARVDVEVLYLNHDFAAFLGIDIYEEIANSIDIYHTGFGDWYFRQLAFPDLPDNRDAYFKRHYRHQSKAREVVTRALARRDEIGAFLNQWIETHRLHEADVVGSTALFAQTVAAIAIARHVKAANPRARTVLGGACCEGVMGRELALRVADVDYVFSGGALVSFPAFVGAALDGTLDHARIPGVLSRRGPRRLDTVGDCAGELGEELDIDDVIEPDYDDYLASFQRKVAREGSTPALLFETSRGCWWGEIQHCTFCGLNGLTMRHREMSADKAVAHLQSLFRRYPDVTYFQAVDNILPHGYLKTVLPRLDTPPRTTIYYEVKSNMDDADVRTLAQSGVRMLQPGIESINTSILKLMKKGVTAFQNIRFLGYCRLHGIAPKWNFLIGFPGESEAVYPKYLADLPLLHHLPPPDDVAPVRFDRYSPYHARAGEYALKLRPFDYYGFVYPYDAAALKNLAYHFVHDDPRFYVPIARWQKKIQACIDTWHARWSGADGQPRAQLHLERTARGAVVHDTRAGAAVEHLLDDAAERVLAALARPRSIDALAASLPDLDVAREVTQLRARGLLFEEDGRYLSVVLSREPAQLTWDRDDLWSYGNLPAYLFTR
jgi:ribosomal peptide maturation radical SAM protein 1